VWRITLTRQFSIGEPLASRAVHGECESARVIEVFSVVVTEYLFVNVTIQMEGFDSDIRSMQTTFQQRPEILQTVRMNATLDVLLRVVNPFVDVFHSELVISNGIVREDRGTRLDTASSGTSRFAACAPKMKQVGQAILTIERLLSIADVRDLLLDEFHGRTVTLAEIYNAVQAEYPSQCSDSDLCTHETPSRPEWQHRVRQALDSLHNKQKKIQAGARGQWIFPK
jgi:hypothetical protein